jgi:single-strand DNA-binding protein
MTLPTIHATGNLTSDPELRFTKSGDAVATVNLATNRSRKDANDQWETTHTTYLSVKLWKQDAEAAAEHLRKGDRVVVSGELLIEEWEGKDGNKRQTPTIDRAAIAKALPRGQRSAPAQAWTADDDAPPF